MLEASSHFQGYLGWKAECFSDGNLMIFMQFECILYHSTGMVPLLQLTRIPTRACLRVLARHTAVAVWEALSSVQGDLLWRTEITGDIQFNDYHGTPRSSVLMG